MDNTTINQRRELLDDLLRKGSFSKEELMDKLNAEGFPISRRTLEYDLGELRSKAPIKTTRDGTVKRFTYEEKGDSYFCRMDTCTRMALERFLALAHSVQGLEKIQEIKDMELHLRKEYGIEPVSSVMSFPKAELRPLNAETIECLYQAIIHKKVVQFNYESYNKPEASRLRHYKIHPYHLTAYNSRWYLIGYTPEHGDYTVVPTDRMLGGITELEGPYREPPVNADYEALFKDRIGIGDGPKIDLKIAVGHTRFRYFSSRKFHPYQECQPNEETEDGRKIFVYRQIVENEELRQKLLSFGKEIEVLEPLSLRCKLHTRIRKMQELYATPTHIKSQK